MNDIVEILIRTTCALFLMMIIVRILGKQTFVQMTYRDFATAITLGAITANFNIYKRMKRICIR